MDRYAPAVGLYSIGVRGVRVPDLAVWAGRHEIPFLHLRGGARGAAAMRQTDHELDRWRTVAEMTAPIRIVTTDITLEDLTAAATDRREAAERELRRAAETARRLGAGMIRILADTPRPVGGRLPVPRLPEHDISVLIEPHDASWWEPAGIDLLDDLSQADERIRLLADTAQAAALAGHSQANLSDLAEHVIALSRVVHLSDNGTGLSGFNHQLLAASAARAVARGQPLEIAFEWTGPDRTHPVCLARYRDACAWWHAAAARTTAGGVR
jgi:hypothetical protein